MSTTNLNQFYISKYWKEMSEKHSDLSAIAAELQTIYNAQKSNQIRFLNSKEICSPDLLAIIVCEYYERMKLYSVASLGNFHNQIDLLSTYVEAKHSAVADDIASVLDPVSFDRLFSRLARGVSYRKFLLSYIAYIPEEKVPALLEEIETKRVGNAKASYWAQNARFALTLKPCAAVVRFFKDEGYSSLAFYAEHCGNTVSSLLYKYLLPATTADPEKNFEIREEAIDDFFLMHLSNDTVPKDVWESVYKGNPVLSELSSGLVWMDNNGELFTNKNGENVDAFGEPVCIGETIFLPSVIDIPLPKISEWRSYFSSNKIVQPFGQINELVVETSPKAVKASYEGKTIKKNNLKKMQDYFNSIKMNFNYTADNIYIGRSVRIQVEQTVDKKAFSIKDFKRYSGHRRDLNFVMAAILDYLEP